MGFGTLFATVAFFILMATGAFLFTTNIMYTAEVVSTSLEASSDLQYARLKTDIEIETASVSNDEITVSIGNTGSMKILDSEFKYMDVYVRYRRKDFGNIIVGTKRIPYTMTNPPPADYWTNTSISYDYINPGIFDPDEYLNILIHVSHDINRTVRDKNYVRVVTPNGVWATKTGF
jgi:hypothetical protein